MLACLDDEAFELQVEAWTRELRRAGAADADLLYLHHLTPLNEAAARAFPEIPVLGHVHGTELLMLERIAAGRAAELDARRAPGRSGSATGRRAASGSSSAAPKGLKRAAAVLDLDPDRFVCIPNGFDPELRPAQIDRRAHWRRHLVERPQGWRPGSAPGSVAYEEADLEALDGTVLLYSGRFTEVKRLPLLIEAYALARPRFAGPTALVLLGGYPGEWEGEHPIEAIERLGCSDVFLAGWHSHAELPDFLNAADLLVHASVQEQFGQVLVEAMACGLPVIAVDRGGPATIVDDPDTGWLVPPDDVGALAAAMVEAVNDAAARRLRGQSARGEVVGRYSWRQIGADLASSSKSSPASLPRGSRQGQGFWSRSRAYEKQALDVGGTLSQVFSDYGAQAGTLLPIAFWLFLVVAIVYGLISGSLIMLGGGAGGQHDCRHALPGHRREAWSATSRTGAATPPPATSCARRCRSSCR